jgi:hypothetical protein
MNIHVYSYIVECITTVWYFNILYIACSQLICKKLICISILFIFLIAIAILGLSTFHSAFLLLQAPKAAALVSSNQDRVRSSSMLPFTTITGSEAAINGPQQQEQRQLQPSSTDDNSLMQPNAERTAAATAAATDNMIIPNQYIVVLKPTIDTKREALAT